MSLSRRDRFITLLSNLLALPILCWPLWKYGFPFLYSDSGTYLIAKKWGIIPIDRPVAYSDFISFIADLSSVYLLPVFQAVLVLYVLHVFIRYAFDFKLFAGASAVIAVVLALTTGLPHHINQLMPDLLTPLLLLIAYLLLVRRDFLPKIHLILLWILLGWICATHSTHMLLIILLAPFMWLVFRKKTGKRGWVRLASVLLVGAFSMPINNLLHSGRFYYSDSSRVFLTASLHTAGVLEPWLDKHCGEENAPAFLCDHQDEIRQISGNDILWGSELLVDSICLAEGGWGNCWKVRNQELKPLVSSWWKDPEILKPWLAYAFQTTGKQCVDFGIGMISSQKEGTAPYNVLNEAWQKDLPRYTSSKQFESDLYFYQDSKRQLWMVILSSIILLFFVFVRKSTFPPLYKQNPLLLSLLFFLIANAAVCGVLSNPLDRYQARVIWLIPCFALIYMFRWMLYRWKKEEDETDIEHSGNSSIDGLSGKTRG